MDAQCLTPALERLWLDKAHHLRSHRRAPPRNPNPNPESVAITNLRPANSTAFKKEERRRRKERKRQKKQLERQQCSIATPDPVQPSNRTVSDIQWPCEPVSDRVAEATGWTVPIPKPVPEARPPASAEEQARIVAMQVQQNGIRVCQDFFSKNDGDDDEEEEEAEEDAMDEDSGVENGVNMGFLRFFTELFENDGDLRGFYEKNWEKGEFCCLVCGGIGAKIGKRFSNCVGLVQHSNTISKTKRRAAHRAFGRAVCRVLGWDINRLPGIFLDAGEQDQLGNMKKEGASNQIEELPEEVSECAW